MVGSILCSLDVHCDAPSEQGQEKITCQTCSGTLTVPNPVGIGQVDCPDCVNGKPKSI